MFIFSLQVRTRRDNVAGVNLPTFVAYQDSGDTYELTGLSKGGQQITKLKKAYAIVINLLVELATLQSSFITLDEIIKVNYDDFRLIQF